MRKKVYFLILAASILIGAISCSKSNTFQELSAEETSLRDAFMQSYFPDEEAKSSGLYFIHTLDSDSNSVKSAIGQGDEVEIFYTGRLLSDSSIFATNTDTLGRKYEPLIFVVGNSEVIAGLDEGITYMKVGDEATLIIPSNLGYGSTNNSALGIPWFSTLIFDIEVEKHTLSENL